MLTKRGLLAEEVSSLCGGGRIKKFAEGEFHTWTDDEIADFEKKWPIGTRERKAFALLLYTGQRASDVAKMSATDIEDGGIWVVQQKTKAKLLIPVHPDLLKTAYGEPFTSKGFSNFMADKIGAAGLPERCVTHGLRKAAARRLAEAGCSANEIAAVTGHVTLEEVARYTKAAEQKKLARAAIERLSGGGTSAIKFPNLADGFGKNGKKDNKINANLPVWRPVGDAPIIPDQSMISIACLPTN
jgi:integrase